MIALNSQVCSLWSNFSHFIFLPLFSFFSFLQLFQSSWSSAPALNFSLSLNPNLLLVYMKHVAKVLACAQAPCVRPCWRGEKQLSFLLYVQRKSVCAGRAKKSLLVCASSVSLSCRQLLLFFEHGQTHGDCTHKSRRTRERCLAKEREAISLLLVDWLSISAKALRLHT